MKRWLTIFFLLCVYISARTQQFNWAVSMGGPNAPTFPNDRGESIIVDGSGNVYTVGAFVGSADFDPGPGTFILTAAPGTTDIFIQKLDASGNFIWARGIIGSGASGAYGVEFDPSGNMVVNGFFWGTKDFDPGPGTQNLTSAGNADIFVMKLTKEGNYIWAKSMGGTMTEGGLDIEVDPTGNIITIGRFQGTVDFDPGPGVQALTATANFDIFLSKLDGSGNYIWAKKIGGSGYDNAESVCLDSNGDIIFTGSFGLTCDMDPGPGMVNFTATNNDIFVEKLDAGGNFIWAKQMMGDLSSHATGVAVDAANNIYYTGWLWGTADFDPGPGMQILTSVASSRDIFISRLTPAGELTWVKKMGDNASDEGLSLTLDGNGNVYTTGYFRGTVDFDPGPATFTLSEQDGSDEIFIQKLDASGNFLWAGKLSGPFDDRGLSITVRPFGHIHLTGYYTANSDMDPGPNTFSLTAVGGADIFILKLSQLTTGIISPGNPFQLTVFPNPATGVFYLRSKSTANKKIVAEFQNILGQTLHTVHYQPRSNDHTEEVSTNSLPAGYYFLRITIDGKTYLRTFIKQE